MTVSVAQKRKDFFKLHESGCFVLPNPWDVGSARLLAALGYKALASTSAGFAWSQGRGDYGLKLNELLEHLTLFRRQVPLRLLLEQREDVDHLACAFEVGFRQLLPARLR